MCERCDEIDNRIERYERVAGGTVDKAALAAIETIITNLEAEQAALHLEAQK